MNAKLLKILTAIKEFICKLVCNDRCCNYKDCKDCQEWNGKVKKCEDCEKGASKVYEI